MDNDWHLIDRYFQTLHFLRTTPLYILTTFNHPEFAMLYLVQDASSNVYSLAQHADFMLIVYHCTCRYNFLKWDQTCRQGLQSRSIRV